MVASTTGPSPKASKAATLSPHQQHQIPKTLSTPTSSSTSNNNVRVVGRIRPLAAYEIANGSKPVIQTLPSTGGESGVDDIMFVEPSDATAESRWFQLDAVLDGSSTQNDVYQQSGARRAVTQDLFQGFNCTILAYGQTGAGKTFTMGSAATAAAVAGAAEAAESGGTTAAVDGITAAVDSAAAAVSSTITDDCGVIPRACADLFATIQTRCQGQATVELSYLEVYNEEIRDLLSTAKATTQQQQLRIREQLNGQVYVRGLESRVVASPADVGRLMEQASARRVTASTSMNAVSSRSHAICVLRIQGTTVVASDDDDGDGDMSAGSKFEAKLTLVDLAGSERIKKTGAQGDRAQEGISINKGLFVLGQVVSALSEQRPKMKRKPPYRDSKLTRLLQDSLGGNSKTIMIACVSPADFNLEESINTLRYATSARNIKNTATRNVSQSMSQDEAAKLIRENELLKQEVRELQQTIKRMAIESDVRDESLVKQNVAERASVAVIDSIEPPDSSSRISELELKVRHLQEALEKSETERRTSTAASAVELPALKVKVALLEDELNASRLVEAETEHLRQEYDELKKEASTARTAAKRLSHIVQDLSHRSFSTSDDGTYDLGHISLSSIGSEILDDTTLLSEFERAKANEAWVSFIVRIYSLFKEDMRVLGDHFDEVTKIAGGFDDDKSLTSDQAANKRKPWWNPQKESKEERMKVKDEETDFRARKLNEHISSYNTKFLEIEDRIESRFDSLISVEDSVQKDRERLENKLSIADINVNDAMKNSKVVVLLNWLKVTLGITTKATNLDEGDVDDADDESMGSQVDSVDEPFTLFDASTNSMAFDDSVAEDLCGPQPPGMLGKVDDDSGDSDDEDMLF